MPYQWEEKQLSAGKHTQELEWPLVYVKQGEGAVGILLQRP